MAYFLIVLAVWIWRAWRALEALREMPLVEPLRASKPALSDLVTVIIPAKNEEANIRGCLESLLAQDHPRLQILVVNDNSADGTEAVLRAMGIPLLDGPRDENAAPAGDGKIGYLNCAPTPPGWTGKNYAIHSALPKAMGRWLLFTDADTRHEPASVSSAVDYAVRSGLEFLTLTPRCLTGSFFEDLIQPCAMAFIGLWFPFRKVNDPGSKTFFANGQYLLMSRQLYERTGGHAAVRKEFLEDFALMKAAKKSGASARWAHGIRIYGTRMYHSLGSSWRGWRRIFLHAFERRPRALAARAASVLAFSVLPFTFLPVLASAALTWPEKDAALLALAIPTLLFIIAVTAKAYRILGAKRVFAVLQPAAALVLFGILGDAAWMAMTKKKTVWR